MNCGMNWGFNRQDAKDAKIMKERPILFSGEMVRAIREGGKTQTRRIVKDEVVEGATARGCPYGTVGDRLWVKETFAICSQVDGNGFPTDRPYLPFAPLQTNPKFTGIAADYIIYRADGETEFADEDGDLLVRKNGTMGSLWKPSIFMCREYSRIPLEIVNVRVERLQDCLLYTSPSPRDA